jgi:(p)ppGpp synthase/HD superfamily hydrolase
MEPENPITTALFVACNAHRTQVDKVGQPYILHVIRVMLRCTTLDEMVVAVLHDVVEDSDIGLQDLQRLGFSEQQLDAVDRLTRRDDQSYMDHIERCAGNPLSKVVKMADLDDHVVNYDPKVLSAEHVIRYSKAWRYLNSTN